MKFAVIVPSRDLTTFEGCGDLCMSLTQIVLEDEQYARYYKQQSEDGRFIILDNGLFEMEQEGIGMSVDYVLDAAQRVGAHELIATDVLFDGAATVERTKEFIAKCKEKNNGQLPFQVMAVPQAPLNQVDEWIKSLDALVDIEGVTTIGLSKLGVPGALLGEWKSSANAARSRIQMMQILREQQPQILLKMTARGQRFHCLGSDNWSAYELRSHAQWNYDWMRSIPNPHLQPIPLIRSMDTSAYWVYGCAGKVFDINGKIDEIILDKPPLEKGSYQDVNLPNGIGARSSVLYNISLAHKFSKDVE